MKNFLVILLLIPFLFACDEGGEPQPQDPDPEPTKQELAIRSWKVVKVSVGTTDLDSANYSFQFNENGNFSISAPDVDDPDFPGTGSWTFNSNNQKIMLEGSVELDVIMLDEDEFILEYSYQNFKEGDVIFRFEMVPA